MSTSIAVLSALLGGILPTLLWLWFFLREDKERPEPSWLIVSSFLVGMLAVVVALPVEMLAKCVASGVWPPNAFSSPIATFGFCRDIPAVEPIFLWAAVEELVKYFMVVVVVLWRRAVDEPIDAMIYLITVALGFSALETGLFLLGPMSNGDIAGSILTGNLRFVGAALIHTLSSSVIGFAIAITFYRSYIVQFVSLCTGLMLAVVLHALFNHHIIASSGGEKTIVVFFSVWLGIVGLFLLFERAKHITRPQF